MIQLNRHDRHCYSGFQVVSFPRISFLTVRLFDLIEFPYCGQEVRLCDFCSRPRPAGTLPSEREDFRSGISPDSCRLLASLRLQR